jgi:hypothetical protein
MLMLRQLQLLVVRPRDSTHSASPPPEVVRNPGHAGKTQPDETSVHDMLAATAVARGSRRVREAAEQDRQGVKAGETYHRIGGVRATTPGALCLGTARWRGFVFHVPRGSAECVRKTKAHKAGSDEDNAVLIGREAGALTLHHTLQAGSEYDGANERQSDGLNG